MNHHTVDYVVRRLPQLVRSSLDACCRTPSPLPPEAVSDILTRAITSLDQVIISDFQDLFPGGEGFVAHASPEQLRRLINDVEGTNNHYAKVARVLGGTTALVTLYNEGTGELWVANLGDCCAGSPVLPCA